MPSTEQHGAPFSVPAGWRCRSRRGVVVATGPEGRPPPRLVWRRGSRTAYDAEVVEDQDTYELDGQLVDYRRLGHRQRGVELVSEEWTWRGPSGSRVLTGTVARADYLAVCDLFEDVAATVDPGGP